MTDFFNNIVTPSDTAEAREEISRLTKDLEDTRASLLAVRTKFQSVRDGLQEALTEWAGTNLDSSDTSYRELSELMIDNGLDGLTRQFTVTVRATYEFEVEVEAANADAAQGKVDNDILSYAGDYLNPGWESPDETDFYVTEA